MRALFVEHLHNFFAKMNEMELEAKLDMLEKRLQDAQRERKKNEDRFQKTER